MFIRSGWFRFVLFYLVVLLVITCWNGSVVFAGEPQWVEVHSPNFSVVTDAGEKRGREVAMRFEQMRAAFATLMTKANVNLPTPLQIVAFRNTKEMRQVAPLFHGKPTELAGLFQGDTDRNFIMLDMSVEDPWTVVFHEYAHELMNGNLHGALDPWFEEGFAEYFSSIEVDSKEARVGKIPNTDYLILQQMGMMSMADLFKVRQNTATYNERGDHRTTFYAESGMLVHYLYDHGLLPKVAVYFDLEKNRHVSVEEALQQAFGMSALQFDKVLRDYVSSGRYKYYPIPNPVSISPSSYTAAPLRAVDSNAVLADIHLHSHDYQDRALSEFQDILKSDPDNAAACRGLGYAYLQKQDFTQAAEYFKHASAIDFKDPRVHYYNALLMVRMSGFGPEADLPAMTKELESAISLDPTLADSYALLAFAQSASGDPVKALATMQKALVISPRNESYLYNLANLYLANRQPDQAVAILEPLQGTDNPALASQVAGLLAQVRQIKEALQASQEAPGSAMALVLKDGSENTAAQTTDQPSSALPVNARVKWGPPKFVRGTVDSVDCSTEPSAMLTLGSGGKTLKLNVLDRNHVILIGAEQFSCTWNQQKVAVNYRENDAGETSVVSVELQ